MERYFNTAGPCRPELHYMLPPERRLEGVRRLISRQQYFTVHAPRQVGKTTSFLALADSLLRDVHDYRVRARDDAETLGTASPFNIKVESIRLRDFTAEEVAELYGQHTAATSQAFSPEALDRVFELTRGQPWLVNALGAELVDRVAEGAETITADAVERAKELLILRQDTHLDSLIERLREPRVQRVLEPLLAGAELEAVTETDDLRYTHDLGLIAEGASSNLEIANPIYHEIIPRALASVTQRQLPLDRRDFISTGGALLFERLLDQFTTFWLEHAESYLSRQPYSEAAAQLIFMAYLQRVVNGGGFVDREYGAGAGRIDLHVRWPRPDGALDRFAVELKVWRQGAVDPVPRGLDQLADYLDRLGLDRGTLVIFDSRENAPPLPRRADSQSLEHRGKHLDIRRL